MSDGLRGMLRVHAYGAEPNFLEPQLAGSRKRGVGAAFFVDPPAAFRDPHHLYALTCAHCVDEADTVGVTSPALGREEVPAHVLAFVPRHEYDVALLRIEAGEPGEWAPYGALGK